MDSLPNILAGSLNLPRNSIIPCEPTTMRQYFRWLARIFILNKKLYTLFNEGSNTVTKSVPLKPQNSMPFFGEKNQIVNSPIAHN